jgi:hypothetical protein
MHQAACPSHSCGGPLRCDGMQQLRRTQYPNALPNTCFPVVCVSSGALCSADCLNLVCPRSINSSSVGAVIRRKHRDREMQDDAASCLRVTSNQVELFADEKISSARSNFSLQSFALDRVGLGVRARLGKGKTAMPRTGWLAACSLYRFVWLSAFDAAERAVQQASSSTSHGSNTAWADRCTREVKAIQTAACVWLLVLLAAVGVCTTIRMLTSAAYGNSCCCERWVSSSLVLRLGRCSWP